MFSIDYNSLFAPSRSDILYCAWLWVLHGFVNCRIFESNIIFVLYSIPISHMREHYFISFSHSLALLAHKLYVYSSFSQAFLFWFTKIIYFFLLKKLIYMFIQKFNDRFSWINFLINFFYCVCFLEIFLWYFRVKSATC